MKNILLLVLPAWLMFMCSDEPTAPSKGRVSLGVSVNSPASGRTSSVAVDEALITIKKVSGEIVYDGKVTLTSFGDGYVSDQLEFPLGEYALVKYILLKSGEAKYAAPVEGSERSHWVERPLPISFSVRKDEVTALVPEVVSIAGSGPAPFGYVEFGFEIINEDHAVGIHVVGQSKTTPASKWVAKYWRNGIAFDLTDGVFDAKANKVLVAGSDVYIVGHDGRKAVLWKNGTRQCLTDGTDVATATDIAVLGTDVYICGSITHQQDLQEYEQAVYWKNNQLMPLTGISGSHTSASAIAVAGNDVYVIGTRSTGPYHEPDSKRFPIYWKNNEMLSLTQPVTGLPGTFNETGTDIEVAGPELFMLTQLETQSQSPTFYKHPFRAWTTVNGENVENPNGSALGVNATDIEIDGEDVCIVGTRVIPNNETATLLILPWHLAGVRSHIALRSEPATPEVYSDAFGVTATDKAIYVCGRERGTSKAVYWILPKPVPDGIHLFYDPVYLPQSSATESAYAYSIFVKEG